MEVVIAGAGGHGRVVLDILRAAGTHTVHGFLDANQDLHGTQVDGVPVVGHLNLLPKLKAKGVGGAIVAIGDNRVRRSYAQKLSAAGLELVNAIHPSATVSPNVTVGRNVMIAPGVIVCVGAAIGDSVILNTGAAIGDSVILNTGAKVDHECEIGEAVHLAPGVTLAGRVRVGEGAFVGIGANVLPCLMIGAHAVVGGGALVREDVPAGATAVGVPARVIKAPGGPVVV